ncbi:MAG: MFS transporter [Desulfobacteraceae bacterium]|nr:MFS transporter [Desulfobacteraceae bacterium]
MNATAGARLMDHPLFLFPDFRRVFAARLISAVGDKFYTIALAWWIISQGTNESKFHLGLLMAFNLLPVVLFGPFMGTLVDRLDKKRCMIAADLLRAMFVGILAVLLHLDALSLPLLYLLCFATSVLVPLFESSVSSSLVSLTDEVHVSGAVALDSMVIQIANILGAAIGAIFLAAVGSMGAFLLNAASFLVSALFVFRIRIGLPRSGSTEDYGANFREGFSYLWSQKPILWLLAAFAFLNFTAAPLSLMIPMIVQFQLNDSVSTVALFEAFLATGTGVLTFILSFRQSYRNIYPLLFGAIFLMGAVLGGLSITYCKPVICAQLLAVGMALALVDTVALSLFQHVVPPDMKGRFFALLTTTCFAVIPLSFLVNGILSQVLTVSELIFMNGVLTMLLAVPLLFVPRIADHLRLAR